METERNDNLKNTEKKEETKKIGFIKKVWYSLIKIEKYPDMAADGFYKALVYASLLIIILSIVLGLGYIISLNKTVLQATNYIENEIPGFNYKDGVLAVEQNEKIEIKTKKYNLGDIIIDTKVEDENEINKYVNDISTNEGTGILILKGKMILINYQVNGNITYNYNDIFDKVEANNFSKEDVIKFVKGKEIISLYISIFIAIVIYTFLLYILTFLTNAVFLSIFGYLTAIVARIKMRYVAIFNMSVYALTLSTILNILYIGINIFIEYNIEYFQVMYIAVAAIYLVAAIFLLKSEFIKKQAELMKVIEKEAEIKKDGIKEEEKEEKEEKEENKEEKDKKENDSDNKNEEKKEDSKKDKDKKENNESDNNIDTDSAEGSNA